MTTDTQPTAQDYRDVLQLLRDTNIEVGQLRDEARRIKLAFLNALGFTDPWAVTVVSEKQMLDKIAAIQAERDDACAEADRLSRARVQEYEEAQKTRWQMNDDYRSLMGVLSRVIDDDTFRDEYRVLLAQGPAAIAARIGGA